MDGISISTGELYARRGATPYDIKDVEFGHVGGRCIFDAVVHHFSIDEPALDRVATIVRGADTSRPDLTPQCPGLLAICHGLSANFPDNHEMLKHGLTIYSALYACCRMQPSKNSAWRMRIEGRLPGHEPSRRKGRT